MKNDSLTNSVKNKAMSEHTNKEAREELAGLSPLLSRIRQSEPAIESPENYFRDMQQDVLWRLKTEQTAAPAPVRPAAWERWAAVFQVFKRPSYVVGFATVVLAIVAAFWIWSPTTNDTDTSLASLTEEETLAYIENNIEDFDTDLLAQTIAGNTFWTGASGLSEEDTDRLLEELLLELDADSLEKLF